MDFQFGAAAGGGVALPSGVHFAAPPFHGNQEPPQRPLYARIPDPRSAGLTASATAAAPPFGGHFAVLPFQGSQQPLYPSIPDSRSAGLNADAAREVKKARIREEILAREAEEDRLLEQEVRRELQFERAMAERLREVQRLGLFPPMPGLPAYRVAEPSVGDSVLPPPNAGPYLVPYTPQAWGRERQAPVQSPPGNLERPEAVEVPYCSGETHPLHIDYKLEDSVGKKSGSVSVPAENNLGMCSLPIAHGVGGERPGSVHHSDNQGPLLPISHHLESTAGEQPGSGKAPDQLDLLSGKRSALPNGNCPENVGGERPGLIHRSDDRTLLPKADHPEANIGKSLPSSSLPQDYEFFTRLETKLLGHHPDIGVSGGPPLAAHPVGVDGQPIRPPSHSDIGASKLGKDCSGKGKKKAKVKMSAKKAPIEGDAQKNCHRCGQSGHKKSSCRLMKKEAKTHEKVMNRKRKLQIRAEGYVGFNGICFQCGGIGHRQTDCLPMHKQDATSSEFGRKCFHCGATGHVRKYCPVSGGEVHKNNQQKKKKRSGEEVHKNNQQKKKKRKMKMKTG